jgi:integrase
MASNWYERAVQVSQVRFLNEGDAFFNATLDGWTTQRISAGNKLSSISQEVGTVRQFARFCECLPWQWSPADLEGFTVYLLSEGGGKTPLRHSTIRSKHGAIRRYCEYLLHESNGWASLALERFGSWPNQVSFEWNSHRHVDDDEADPDVRGFTYAELNTLWAAAREWVQEIASSGQHGRLSAMRDVVLFKTAWAFALRRNELRMLDLADLHHNPSRPAWGQYGKVHVRHGKSTRGGPPKRRTVLLLPMYEGVVPELRRWIETTRPQMHPGPLEAVFVTERHTRISLRSIDDRFALLRDFAGLPKVLTMHSFRRSYITQVQEHGIPQFFAQAQAGHANAATTGIYTSVTDEYRARVVLEALKDYDRLDADDPGQRVGVERPPRHGPARDIQDKRTGGPASRSGNSHVAGTDPPRSFGPSTPDKR